MLLEARALGAAGSSDAQKEAARQTAVDRLEAAIAQEPRFRDAYHALADVEQARGRRPAAIDALQRDLKTNPQDSVAVAKLVQLLAGPGASGQPASAGDLEEARKFAAEVSQRDKEGSLVLAAGVGFHKAAQFELALPFSEKAATMLDNPVAHLNLGDLLLSMAESQPDQARARPIFERAVQEYDRVLKVQPAQVEAVNNKAWVLHTYLERSQQALELAQGLMKRVEPVGPPGRVLRHPGRHPGIAGPHGARPSSRTSRGSPSLPTTPCSTTTSARCSPPIATGRCGPRAIWPRPLPRRSSSVLPWPRTPRGWSSSSAGPSRETEPARRRNRRFRRTDPPLGAARQGSPGLLP